MNARRSPRRSAVHARNGGSATCSACAPDILGARRGADLAAGDRVYNPAGEIAGIDLSAVHAPSQLPAANSLEGGGTSRQRGAAPTSGLLLEVFSPVKLLEALGTSVFQVVVIGSSETGKTYVTAELAKSMLLFKPWTELHYVLGGGSAWSDPVNNAIRIMGWRDQRLVADRRRDENVD